MSEFGSVVERMGALLKAVSAAEPRGANTSAVARVSNVSRPTAHRLLSALASQGLLERDAATGDWFLGPEMFLLGVSAAPRYDTRAVAQPRVRYLADSTGESAFYSVRRGWDTVCLIREDGAFPIRSHVLFEGARFPLGVVSAGLVILAFMPEREADRYLEEANLEAEYGPAHSPDEVRARLQQVRSVGWALNPGLVVEGSWGMAAAVFNTRGEPIGALTLTGIESRFAPQRQPDIGALLLTQAHELSRRART